MGKLGRYLDSSAIQAYVKPTLEKLGSDPDADVVFFAKQASDAL
ncbi:unnamed protein product, partial [Dibothriocephalus latus]